MTPHQIVSAQSRAQIAHTLLTKKLTILSGPSGSGKSHYITSLGADSDRLVEGVNDECRSHYTPKLRAPPGENSRLPYFVSFNPGSFNRSSETVASILAIDQILSRLLKRSGTLRCEHCKALRAFSTLSELKSVVLGEYSGSMIELLITRSNQALGKDEFLTAINSYTDAGFTRGYIDQRELDLEGVSNQQLMDLRNSGNTLRVLIDRFQLSEGHLTESLQIVSRLPHDGVILKVNNEPVIELAYSQRLCTQCWHAPLAFDKQELSLKISTKSLSSEDQFPTAWTPENAHLRWPLESSLNEIDIPTILATPIDQLIQTPLVAGDSRMLCALNCISALGLGYLSLSRTMRSLSIGESYLVQLGRILANSQSGLGYALDAALTNWAANDLGRIQSVLTDLVVKGNFVIWVSNQCLGDAATVLSTVDDSPGDPTPSFTTQSPTLDASPKNSWRIDRLKLDNGSVLSASIPYQSITCVTGGIGSGKTLLLEALAKHAIESTDAATRRADRTVAANDGFRRVIFSELTYSPRHGSQNVGSAIGILREIGKLYALSPQARVDGLDLRDFLLTSPKLECKACTNRSRFDCTVCLGSGYSEEIGRYLYRSQSLDRVLALKIGDLASTFENVPKIQRLVSQAIRFELDSLYLDQPVESLSAGESRRLRLVLDCPKVPAETLWLIDTPAVGMNSTQALRLIKTLKELCQQGGTLVIADNESQLINLSQHRIVMPSGSST